MRSVVGTFPTFATQVMLADLLTITLVSGTIMRLCSGDTNITAFGFTFSSAGALFKRGKTRLTTGLEVDVLDITLMTGETTSILGLPIPQAASNGALDGATVKLERAYMTTTWGNVDCTVNLFEGRVAEVSPSHTEVKLSVKSLIELLNMQWPKNLYQPSCGHQLYGTGCGVIRSSFQVNGTATGGTTTQINWSGGGKPAGWFDLGVVTFITGANAGARRTIKSSTGSTMSIALPLPFPVAAGDAFQVVPGCDKSFPTCLTKFNNLARFRGFPWVPKPETAR